jgi:hypothetical protein
MNDVPGGITARQQHGAWCCKDGTGRLPIEPDIGALMEALPLNVKVSFWHSALSSAWECQISFLVGQRRYPESWRDGAGHGPTPLAALMAAVTRALEREKADAR